jgi:hypothetical protein
MVDRVAIVGAVQAALLADAGLSALVGDRIFLLEAPSDADAPQTPYIVTERIRTRGNHTDAEAEGVIMTLSLAVWGSEDAGPAIVAAAGDAVHAALNCWGHDGLGILPSTRRSDTDCFKSGRAYVDQSTYRLHIFGG